MKEHVLNVSGEGYLGYGAPEFTAEQNIYVVNVNTPPLHM
jgi:hypothetical protein